MDKPAQGGADNEDVGRVPSGSSTRHDRDAASPPRKLEIQHSELPDEPQPEADLTTIPHIAPLEERAGLGNAEVPPDVPDYSLIECIGKGGFGTVWLARERLTGVLYAIKLLPRDVLGQTELEAIRNYKQRTGTHPHLVCLEHVGELPAFYYYVMELADDARGPGLRTPEGYQAVTLAEYLHRHGVLSSAETSEIATQLLSGVGHLHKIGLLHRDIKPANVIRRDNRWKLCDIGLASLHTRTEVNAGTPAYAPPEGIRDRSGDLFSIGLMIHDMLVGYPVSRGRKAEAPRQIRMAEIPGAARGLASVIEKACHHTPDKRFRTADEMLASLPKVGSAGSSISLVQERSDRLSVVIVDADSVPRVALEHALHSLGVRPVRCVNDLGSALAVASQLNQGLHAVYLNPLAAASTDKSIAFIETVRQKWPHIVFVLFINPTTWKDAVPQLPPAWRVRLSHYYRVDRNSGLETFIDGVAASLEGIRYYRAHSGIAVEPGPG